MPNNPNRNRHIWTKLDLVVDLRYLRKALIELLEQIEHVIDLPSVTRANDDIELFLPGGCFRSIGHELINDYSTECGNKQSVFL